MYKRLSLLKKGQLVAGNSKAWLGINSVKEISFSGHTHSNYALTSHTHSNYALTSHTHTGYASKNHTHNQYMTEVDINQMIEDVIDSYVPTIQTMGQVGIFEPNPDNFTTTTITISSSVKVFAIIASKLYTPMMSIKSTGTWYPNSIFIHDVEVTLSSNRITLTYEGSIYKQKYCYFYL